MPLVIVCTLCAVICGMSNHWLTVDECLLFLCRYTKEALCSSYRWHYNGRGESGSEG